VRTQRIEPPRICGYAKRAAGEGEDAKLRPLLWRWRRAAGKKGRPWIEAPKPLACEGQIEGAVAMGIGSALTEEMLFENGLLLNSDWSTYKIPTALDVPPIVPLLVEVPHPDGPYGAKGMGEVGMAPTPPAIANALFNLSGVRIYDLPLTPEKVYWAMKHRAEMKTR